MATHSDTTSAESTPIPLVPPLETGDCLSRAEFERRYEALPHIKKAELIGGVVYVASPVSKLHGGAHSVLTTWVTTYAAQTATIFSADNTTVRFDLENEVQPDGLLLKTVGGLSKTSRDGYIEGPPELVAEVATSSVSRDLHAKLALYRRHGVPEYFVWRVLDGDIDWFRLIDGEYQRLPTDADGIVRSREFPGLWLARSALLKGEMGEVLRVLQQGTASAEHAEFVKQMTAAGAP